MTQAAKIQAPARQEPETRREEPLCVVCGDPVEVQMDSTCRVCSRPVHISWRQGAPESACSQIVSPQACCGIAFVCNHCVEQDGLG